MPDPQHRLDEFEIDEVSAVDRAANGEKFVITKRDEQQADGEKAAEDTKDGEQAQAEGEKASAEPPKDGEQAQAEGEKAEPPAGGGGADEPASPEDEEQGDAGEDGAEADKAAPAHMALLNEQAAALKATVDKVLASIDGEDVDFKAAMDHLDSVWTLIYSMRESAGVVRLMKSAGGSDPFAPIERSILTKQAELIAEARKAPDDEPGMGGDPGAPEGEGGEEAPAGTEGDRWAMVLEKLGALDEKLDRLLETQAKDAVGKALGELQARVTKMEAVPVAPSTGGSGGGARANARKGVDVDWPSDLNAPEKG